MTTFVPQLEMAGKPEGPEADRRDVLVGELVLLALGRPAGFLRVQSRRLWGDFFRVNVFVGESAACALIVNSYFVRADAQGRVVSADPVIAGGG
jgi:hypothetical protein